MWQGLCNDTVFVCLSHLQHAAGLLLSAAQAGDIDRLLHSMIVAGVAAFRSVSTAAWRSAANPSSVMFIAT